MFEVMSCHQRIFSQDHQPGHRKANKLREVRAIHKYFLTPNLRPQLWAEVSISLGDDLNKVVHVDSSSDEDIGLPDIGGSPKTNQNEDDTPSTPPTLSPLLPKSKRQRVGSVQDALPDVPRQLGTLDLITALRADTSFDGGIWSQADTGDHKL